MATIEVTGLGSFIASNQGIVFTFLKPPGARAPIQQEAAQLMGSMSAIPGVMAFLRPFPVLEISTGATNQNQGQYAFAISGVNPAQVYEASAKLEAKMRQFPGFLTVSSVFQQHAQPRHRNPPRADQALRRFQARISPCCATPIRRTISI
jgi:HAE1 family hydrophobic/amphiphilic exporter-1